MLRNLRLGLCTLAIAAGFTVGELAAEPLTSAQIKALFTDATISGLCLGWPV